MKSVETIPRTVIICVF